MRFRVVLVTLAVLVAGGWLADAHAAAAGRGQAQRPSTAPVVPAESLASPTHFIVVQPGDSLWSLGRRYAAPNVDLRRWVYRVELLNRLRSAGLHPGQRLALPSGPGRGSAASP